MIIRLKSRCRYRLRQFIHHRTADQVGDWINRVLASCFIYIILIGSCAGNLLAQTAATSTWQLTTDQNAVVSGNLVAAPQTLSNMQIYYSSGVQRSSPSGTAGAWPAETTENSTRYMQFAVTPEEGYMLFVNSIMMNLYVNSGSNMRANVYYSTNPHFNSKTQIGSTFTLSSSTPTNPNVTATLDLNIEYPDTFYLRIYLWYTNSTTGKYVITNSVVISGTTMPSTCILVAPASLSGFIQELASNPSDIQTYLVSGMNLINTVVIKPPPAFEISADDGSTWTVNGDSISLSVTDGSIVEQPKSIAVRLNAASADEYCGLITHTSNGAANAFVTLAGVFPANEPTMASTIRVDSTTGTTATLSITGGNGVRRIVALRQGLSLEWRPTDGAPIIGMSQNFSTATDQGDGTKIVYDGEDSAVVVTGLVSNIAYTVAVFEYNVATGNSQNYLTSLFGATIFATPAVPTLSVMPATLIFGSVLVSSKLVKSYKLSGSFLKENDTISIGSPTGYSLALSEDAEFLSSLHIPYPNQNLDTTIYVRFAPTEGGMYAGVITHVGGAAEVISLTVTGIGVTTLLQTSEPVGFATLDGGTTGGADGDSVVVTTAEQLYELMHVRENKSTAPLVVQISGTLSGYSSKISVKRTGNISIIGLGSDAGLQGFGMKIVECSNIIIRNLTFSDCYVDEKDALAIEESRNVWIDHCTFTDSPANDPSGSSHDGLLDIKNGSRNVTISYNYFTNHRQTSLLGHTKDQDSDTVMTVTYYRNWFNGTYSRHPRIRFAKAHIVNNLYTNIGSYGVGVTCKAQVLVEANCFENTPTPVLISQINDHSGTLSGDPTGYVKAVDNFTINSGAIIENLNNYSFDPNDYYHYEIVPAEQVKALVMENAGAGVLDTTEQVALKTNETIPVKFLLMQNFPNPFNLVTTISFNLPIGGPVKLTIFDLLGKEVTQVINEYRVVGFHSVRFDASDLPSGAYIYQLQAGNFYSTRKMLLLK